MNFLIACNHPGGTNALLPVVLKLEQMNHNIHIVTSILNIDKFKSLRCTATYFELPVTFEQAEEILNRKKIDFVLTATSEVLGEVVGRLESIGRLESVFVAVSNVLNIHSLSVIDCWNKYKERFSLSNVNKLDAVPDEICAIDGRAKLDMIEEGFDPEIIHVTGNPHWDNLDKIKKELEVNGYDIYEEYSIPYGSQFILFISQPISERNNYTLGYTEESIVNEIIKIIDKNSSLNNMILFIKLHPRDGITKYDDIVNSISNVDVRLLPPDCEIYNLAYVSMYNIGMFSMLLTEFYLLGFSVISYQPVNNMNDVINIGLDKNIITSTRELAKTMSSQAYMQKNEDIQFDSTKNILSRIFSLANIKEI